MDGVFRPMLPLLTLEVVANTVGVGEELRVGVKRDGVHVTSARFNVGAIRTLRKTPSRPEMNPAGFLFIYFFFNVHYTDCRCFTECNYE